MPGPQDSRQEPERDSAPFQDKKEPNPRPDEPTTSDEATLVERDEGAHAEFSAAPSSLKEAPPPEAGTDDPEDR